MKRKVFIFALLVLSLAALAGHRFTCAPEDTLTDITYLQDSEITPGNDYSSSYIRYNCAFSAPSGSVIGTHRNSSPAGQSRTNNVCRRHHQRVSGTDMILKDGKLTGSASLRSFQTFLKMFPSGKLSESHYFISLNKLVI